MGLDFIRGKPFQKTWNRSKNLLIRPDLFSSVPEWLHRRVTAERVNDSDVGVGDQLLVTLDEHDHVVASRGVVPVAVVTAIPREVLEALKESSSGGAAFAVVEVVRPISNTVELSIQFPRMMRGE
jgi:hypothetical protein